MTLPEMVAHGLEDKDGRIDGLGIPVAAELGERETEEQGVAVAKPD
jgi:hypothetical protein